MVVSFKAVQSLRVVRILKMVSKRPIPFTEGVFLVELSSVQGVGSLRSLRRIVSLVAGRFTERARWGSRVPEGLGVVNCPLQLAGELFHMRLVRWRVGVLP